MSFFDINKFRRSFLYNIFNLGVFESVHAYDPCKPKEDDACGAGDAPLPPNPPAHNPQPCKVCICPSDKSAGDRGLTGAGVTGSRICRDDGDTDECTLPAGARNPGLLRHLHNAARYRIPQCFEGGYLNVKQNTGSKWMVGHQIAFSSVSPGGYKFLLSYLDKEKPTAALPYFLMEAAPGGQMSCEVRVYPTASTRATVVAQVADAELYSFESIFDTYFNNFSTSIIAVNREFVALHYLQAVTEQVSLGAEVVARAHTPELSSASGAARWTNENHSVSATLGNRGLDLCYARILSPNLTVAAMLEVGFAIRRSLATLAYEWNAGDWTVRGSADSDGLVGATLERSLGGGKRTSLSCAISALLNHPNNKFRLGFGVTAAMQ